MPENARLTGCIDQIDVDFVEREATPPLLMKLSIQLHLAGLSLSNTVQFFDIFGVDRARSTVHNWVHKADLQPESGHNPDHVAVDETVIQLNDEQYWLYAVIRTRRVLIGKRDASRLVSAVDADTNGLLHTKLETVRTNALSVKFFSELREKHDVDDAVFLVDGAPQLHEACRRHGLDLHYVRHGDRNSVERVLLEVKRRTSSFSNCFSNAIRETADEWLRCFAFAWNQLI